MLEVVIIAVLLFYGGKQFSVLPSAVSAVSKARDTVGLMLLETVSGVTEKLKHRINCMS